MGSAAAAVVVLAAVVVTGWLHATHHNARVTLLASADLAGMHSDFATFRASAVALVRGADLYDTTAGLVNLNPPVVSVLLAPLVTVPPVAGYRVFAALTLLLVAGALLAVARELRLPGLARVAVLVAVLASSPLHGTLVLGQVYGVLLALFAAGWVAERRGRPALAAALYGVAVALKPSLAPVLLLNLALRRWRPLLAGVAAAGGAWLAGVLAAGPASGLHWLRVVRDEPVRVYVDNSSLAGMAVRFGLPAGLGVLAGAGLLAATLALVARHRDRVDPAGTAAWAVLAAAMLCSPITWHNYLMVLWPGVLVLAATGRRWVAAALLAVALVPVSWDEVWPPAGAAGAVARSLYGVILAGHWLAFALAARMPAAGGTPPFDGAARGGRWRPSAQPRTAGTPTSCVGARGVPRSAGVPVLNP